MSRRGRAVWRIMRRRIRPPRLTLFWRTFLLIALVMGVSLMAWLQVFRAAELSPKAERLAWEIASVVNLTRAALLSTAGERRLALLADLARDEGIRVLPAEPHDSVASWPDPRFAEAFETQLRQLLGSRTRLAARVDGAEGLWVLFEIDDDPYWMRLELTRLQRQTSLNWLGWLGIALALATAAAVLISRLVNRPLANLMQAIEHLARGQPPTPLREDGPWELAALNRRFNRLANELVALDQDRREALAGISHDLRTPLTRLRLDIELSELDPALQASMAEEITRIDAIVQQFVEFARPPCATPPDWIDVAAMLRELCSTFGAHPDGGLESHLQLAPHARWFGSPTVFTRIMANLLENARRYGRDPEGRARVEISATRVEHGLNLTLRDHGPGVPADQLARLTRPFTRLDPARNRDGGAGLGLAIVDRLVRRDGGDLQLHCAQPTGLRVELFLADCAPTDRNEAG